MRELHAKLIVDQAPPVWRAPEGLVGLAAALGGGGRARAGLEIDHSEPQARVWRSRGRAAAHGHRSLAPHRSPPVPSGPSGALHTGGTCVAWTSPARPCCQSHFIPGRRTLIAESTFNFAGNSLTALSNHEFRLLELQRFQTLLKLLPIELHASFLRPGPAVTFRLRG